MSDKLTKHEQGYTLFLTLLTITLFGILGISLVSFTLSGALRSEAREDVTQAGELAEKGFNHLMQEIVTDLNNEINNYPEGVTPEKYDQILDETLDNYICTDDINYTSSVTGSYKACIKDKGENEHPREVTFESYGKAEDREKLLLTTTLFDIEPIPDHMQYAINTFVTEDCMQSSSKCVAGEGNLYLHGGVGVQGDIHAQRHLITSNRSYEKYAAHHWIHSYFPSAQEKPNGQPSSILLGGDIYTVTWPGFDGTKINSFNYSDHVSRLNFPHQNPYTRMDKIDENVFVGSYVAEKSERVDHPKQEDIDIERKKDIYKYERNDPGVTVIETNLFGTGGVDRVIYNEQYPHEKVFPKWYKNFNGKFHIRGHSVFKQFATYGNVELGNIRKNNVIEFIDGAYIEGDLTVGNDVHVKGPIFVNGDLKIKGKNLTLDSIFYVNGQVHIKHATFDETIESNTKGNFIIYANKKIVVERINRFNDYPAKLKAFLYSNESIEMDGNESHIHLHGGLSAPRIVLNSIRGRSYAGANLFKQSDPQIVEARAYEGWAEQQRRDSRLKIIYDGSIIEKYADFILEDRIVEALPPKIIDIEEKYLKD